ncbi:hypothetical protein C4J93_2301 [Pseudomonas sp. R2-37-08W]|nr:hypothetical protein C4J93_2301 [Pseudomonas sp. R2-37-08W]
MQLSIRRIPAGQKRKSIRFFLDDSHGVVSSETGFSLTHNFLFQ